MKLLQAYHLQLSFWPKKFDNPIRRNYYPIDRWLQAKRMADNMKMCSCECCGNPRRVGWLNKKDSDFTIRDKKRIAEVSFEE